MAAKKKRPRKRTSQRVSRLAAQVMSECRMHRSKGFRTIIMTLREVEALCGSVLSQDEVKGRG